MKPIEAIEKYFDDVYHHRMKIQMDVAYKGQLIRVSLENITHTGITKNMKGTENVKKYNAITKRYY